MQEKFAFSSTILLLFSSFYFIPASNLYYKISAFTNTINKRIRTALQHSLVFDKDSNIEVPVEVM